MTTASEVTEAESKIIREVLAAVTVDQKQEEFDQQLKGHDLRKSLTSMWSTTSYNSIFSQTG